jgi:hypothetical protein
MGKIAEKSVEEMMLSLTGNDINLCTCCGKSNAGGQSSVKKEHIPLITIEGLLFLGVRLQFTQVRSI